MLGIYIANHYRAYGYDFFFAAIGLLGVLWLWYVPRCPRCGGRPFVYVDTSLPIAEAEKPIQRCPECGYEGKPKGSVGR